jgi:hypothetical protein
LHIIRRTAAHSFPHQNRNNMFDKKRKKETEVPPRPVAPEIGKPTDPESPMLPEEDPELIPEEDPFIEPPEELPAPPGEGP